MRLRKERDRAIGTCVCKRIEERKDVESHTALSGACMRAAKGKMMSWNQVGHHVARKNWSKVNLAD